MYKQRKIVPKELSISITTALSYLSEDIRNLFFWKKGKAIPKSKAYKFVLNLNDKKYVKFREQLMNYNGKFNDYLDRFRAALIISKESYNHPALPLKLRTLG